MASVKEIMLRPVVGVNVNASAGTAEKLGAMKLRLVYVTEDDSIDKAARLMVENSIARIPVVKDNVTLHCTGIVSATEIARYHKEK